MLRWEEMTYGRSRRVHQAEEMISAGGWEAATLRILVEALL